MFWMALTLLNGTFDRVTSPPLEVAHEVITYHLREDQRGIVVPIYDRVGCAISLSHPFQDVWCSNEQAYVIHQWGENTVIVKNRAQTEHPANLFFFVEGEVVEVLLTQTDMASGKRRVVIELLGLPRPHAKGGLSLTAPQGVGQAPFAPQAMALDPPVVDERDMWLLPLRQNARKAKVSFADVLYGEGRGKGQPAAYVYVHPDERAAPIEKVEVIRGKKKRMGRGWILEYPLPAQLLQKDDTRMLLLDRVALEPGEDLYLRILQKGARNATYTKLAKLDW